MSITTESYENYIRAFMPSRVLITAAELGIFDAIASGAVTAGEIAVAVDADARACRMLLDALAALGFVTKTGDRYTNADLAKERLLTAGPKSDVAMLKHHAGLWISWSHLTDVVRTGRPHEQRRSDEVYRDFIRAMIVSSRDMADQLAEAIDLSQARCLLDMGGGPGTYAIAFCRRYPNLRGVILDLPLAVGVAEEEIAKAGLSDRITVHTADFLTDAIPSGFDAVLISNIIHQFGVDENMLLFQKAREALNPGGRIIVKDMYVDESRTSPLFNALFAINMLVRTSYGTTYTCGEVINLLADCGYVDTRVIPISERSDAVVAVSPQ